MASPKKPPARGPAPKKRAKAKPKKRRASNQPIFAELDDPIIETRYEPSTLRLKGPRSAGAGKPAPGRRIGAGERHGQRWLMQLEYVRCGRCPKAHGPYWYAYKRASGPGGTRGKLVSVYVGRIYDREKALAALRARGAC